MTNMKGVLLRGSRRCLATAVLLFFVSLDLSAQWVASAAFDTSWIGRGAARDLITVESLLVAAGDGGVWRSSDHGATWLQSNDGLTNTIGRSLAFRDGHFFAGTVGGGIFRSAEKAWTWTAVNNGIDLGLTNTRYVMTLLVADSALYASVSGAGIYRSTNGGDNWTALNTGFVGVTFDALTAKEGLLFACASRQGVIRSSDDGTSWMPFNNGLGGKDVRALTTSGPYVFAGTTEGGIFRVRSEDTVWSPVGLGDPMVWTTKLLGVGTTLFAACDDPAGGDVYRSANYGQTWAKTGLSRHPIALVADSTFLYAGTLMDGVWKRPLLELASGIVEGDHQPESLKLLQNYPNPFNPSTTIGYTLPHHGHVMLAVFNALGQQVAELANGERESGYHEVQFNASQLPSGVYFYRLQTGGFVQARSLVVLR